MSPVYIARTKEVAARMLGGEMMIMSALDFDAFPIKAILTKPTGRPYL
jgi:hypothetical protein